MRNSSNYLPDPLNYYEKGFLALLLVISISLIGVSFNFYLTQLQESQNKPSTSISLIRPNDGIPIPDIYFGYDTTFYGVDGVPFYVCNIYTTNNPQIPCPHVYEGISNITFYQQGDNINIQPRHWIRFTFDDIKLQSNNIDNIILYLNTTNLGLSVQDITPQIMLYQRTEQETIPYRLEDIINKAYSISPNGGVYVMTYSLTLFEPLNTPSYYLVNQLYNGFLMYDSQTYESMTSIAPSSPLITINREFVPIGPFNVFSSIWSIISLCFLVLSTLFTRQVPKIHLYFAYRNELSFIRSTLCFCCFKDIIKEEVQLDSIVVKT